MREVARTWSNGANGPKVGNGLYGKCCQTHFSSAFFFALPASAPSIDDPLRLFRDQALARVPPIMTQIMLPVGVASVPFIHTLAIYFITPALRRENVGLGTRPFILSELAERGAIVLRLPGIIGDRTSADGWTCSRDRPNAQMDAVRSVGLTQNYYEFTKLHMLDLF